MEGKISESNKETFEKFNTYWSTGKFSEQLRDSIIYISNQLLKNNAKREPHFVRMINFFMEIDSTFFDNNKFKTWMKSFHYAISQKRRKLPITMRLFNFTLEFSESSALYVSNTRNWYSSSDNYQFIFDTTLKVIYNNTNLKCRFREDSIQVFNTSGTYYPFSSYWNGENGKVTWERTGYQRDNIYAELSDYDIDMSKAEYTADSVKFINKLYFDEPVLGKLEEKLIHISNSSNAIYPVFSSYQSIFEIDNIYENIDFVGGFTMKGSQFIGSGSKNKEATIYVRDGENLLMTAESEIFILQKEKAVSRNASIIIHLKNDSIYHTGLQFNYYVNSQEIELTTNDNVLSESVYYNSYHNLSMKFDRLLWDTKGNKIYFTYGRNSSIGNATFTSSNYFTLAKWEDLKMRDETHPLIALRNFANKTGRKKFDIKKFAQYIRKPEYMVKHRLFPLAKDGFIFYDLDNDTITLNDKLYDFISSRIEKIDYDVIKLQSTTNAPEHNAILSLDSMDLEINGVPRIHLSDSQNVMIYPSNEEIIMNKNRQFTFGGVVNAGLFTFYGKNYNFDYKNFKIGLDSIDSLKMKFQTDEKNMYGQAVRARVENTINNLSGEILIDKPENKSGKDYYPTYPKFESNQKSYVYYDHLFNGPYKRENFYFELYPFKMDSLDNFDPENLKFKGNFHSANIFPPFEETLKLRPDNSMGFEKTTPQEGYPLYEGKGRYNNEIDMSNKGLKGEGTLEYLTSRMETEDILFFPDSTSVLATTFEMKQQTTGIEYPKVSSRNVNIKWYPHDDVMNINQTDTAFTIFNDDIQLNGNLVLKPTGLTGSGVLDMSKAILESDHFAYDSRSFDADSSNFKLRTLDQEEVAFTAEKLNAHIDLDYHRGRFNTLDNYTKSEFHKNLYLAYLDKFTWKMDEDELEIQSYPQPQTTLGTRDELQRLKDFEDQGALFLSKHKGQDSLRFISPEARYSLKDHTIKAVEVDSFYIADARIVPNEKKVVVKETASMDTLRDAEVIADRTKGFHRFFDAKIKIKGRNNYQGEGDYNYVDKNNTKQVIHFNQITVDTSNHTIAQGQISHSDSFNLSPNFRYRGETFLASQRKHLEFKGGARLYHNCPTIKPRYTYFESVINPDQVYIPIEKNIRDLNRNKLFVGSYITIDSTHIYSTFLTPRKDPSDNEIITTKGFLKADESIHKYIIAPKYKLRNPDTTGSLISLHKNYCWLYGEGKMNLGVDFGEMKIRAAGRFDHDLPKNNVKLELTMPMDFLFSKAALDTMVSDIRSRKNLQPISLDSKNLERNLNELYGTKTTNKYLSQAKLFKSEAEIPDELSSTILFSDIDFRWNTSTNSYIARDDIGIAAINGKPVNKYVDGYVEIIKQTLGDKIYIYLKLDEERYYFFYYFRGILRTWSDNKTFTAAIEDVPNRKRKISDGLFKPTKYRYILSTSTSFSRFKKHKKDVEEELKKKEQKDDKEEENKNTQSAKKADEAEDQQVKNESSEKSEDKNKKQESKTKENEKEKSKKEEESGNK
jgi:hypothetical protein